MERRTRPARGGERTRFADTTPVAVDWDARTAETKPDLKAGP